MAVEVKEHAIRNNDRDRISAMLTKLGGRGYFAEETNAPLGRGRIDSDSDPDQALTQQIDGDYSANRAAPHI